MREISGGGAGVETGLCGASKQGGEGGGRVSPSSLLAGPAKSGGAASGEPTGGYFVEPRPGNSSQPSLLQTAGGVRVAQECYSQPLLPSSSPLLLSTGPPTP